MSEFGKRLGKFFIILGGLFLLLFTFSMIADSANIYLIITGVLLIIFGTILRKKPKNREKDIEKADTADKRRNPRFSAREHRDERQSRRSRRS
ncbi:MAG: hypothetical protein Q7U53_14840 [Anaerolineaceae bacterium]|nr:hypothetical protein [Anaerolineaceae bacterium]